MAKRRSDLAMVLQPPPRRTGRPAPDVLVGRRAGMTPSGYPPVDHVVQSESTLAGLDCIVSTVDGARGTLFHLHGGGFRLGGPRRLAPFSATLAARANCTVVTPAYPLAPEEPFPAALHALMDGLDALDVDGPLVISGDSAGGNLAVGLCLQGAKADGLMLMSPWLDLRVTSDGYARAAATDQMFSLASAQDGAEGYLQGHPADDPLASPVLADVAGLPPTLILAGGVEVLLDDSLTFAVNLATALVDVELRVIPDMQHVAPTFSADRAGATAGLDAVISFLGRRFAA